MSYKIRRLKTDVKVSRAIQAKKIWEMNSTINIFKEEIQSLNLQLYYKSYELEKLKQSRYMEHEVYNIITSMLVNLEDDNELNKNLLACDRLISNVLSELYDAIYIYNSSVQKEEHKSVDKAS